MTYSMIYFNEVKSKPKRLLLGTHQLGETVWNRYVKGWGRQARASVGRAACPLPSP